MEQLRRVFYEEENSSSLYGRVEDRRQLFLAADTSFPLVDLRLESPPHSGVIPLDQGEANGNADAPRLTRPSSAALLFSG